MMPHGIGNNFCRLVDDYGIAISKPPKIKRFLTWVIPVVSDSPFDAINQTWIAAGLRNSEMTVNRYFNLYPRGFRYLKRLDNQFTCTLTLHDFR